MVLSPWPSTVAVNTLITFLSDWPLIFSLRALFPHMLWTISACLKSLLDNSVFISFVTQSVLLKGHRIWIWEEILAYKTKSRLSKKGKYMIPQNKKAGARAILDHESSNSNTQLLTQVLHSFPPFQQVNCSPLDYKLQQFSRAKVSLLWSHFYEQEEYSQKPAEQTGPHVPLTRDGSL